MTIASRITRSCVTSLPTISTLLIVAGDALADRPAQVDDRLAVGAGPAGLARLDLRVDVAVVGVEVLDLLGGRSQSERLNGTGPPSGVPAGPTGPNG